MTPVLIDTRSWLKFSFIAVFFAATIFAGGFFLGYQDATAHYQTDSKTVPLALPEEVAVANGSAEFVESERVDKGEDIDVDQADIALTTVDASANVYVEKSKNNKSSEVKDAESDEITFTLQESAPIVSAEDVILNSPKGTSFALENRDDIKYSIQAGVYGRLSNAENAMEQLKADKFDAYVSEYTNKNHEIRYNVRLGYFVDKKSALPTLYRFRKEKNSEAYLVKFSADAVVDFIYEESVAGAVDENFIH